MYSEVCKNIWRDPVKPTRWGPDSRKSCPDAINIRREVNTKDFIPETKTLQFFLEQVKLAIPNLKNQQSHHFINVLTVIDLNIWD